MSSMRRLLPLLVAASLVLFAASCGGEAEVGSEAAKFAPADAAVFATINTDFDSEQYDTARALLDKFPDSDRAVDFVLRELSNQGIDFEEDVRPALGPEVGIVVFEIGADKPSVVGFTQPRDREKLKQLLEQADEPVVTRDVEGWTIFAETEEILDDFEERRGNGALADSDDFRDTMATVSEDGIASAYVNGEAVTQALEQDPATPAGVEDCLPGGVPSIAFAAKAESGGVRVEEAARSTGDDQGILDFTDPYEAQLPDVVPGDVLLYFSFNDLERVFSTFRDCLAGSSPEFEQGLGQLEAALGVSIEEDIAPLFANEGALYVRKAAVIPEVTLLLEVDDEAKAEQTIDDLLAGLAPFAPQLGSPEATQVAGVDVKRIQVPPVSIFYGAFDGRLVVTTSREGIVALREEGDKLADDELFQQAAEDAGMPSETVGYLFVDIANSVQYALDLAGLAGAQGDVPDEVSRNLEPLQHFMVYGTEDGDVLKATAFLAVE
jgi:hypothetical protein